MKNFLALIVAMVILVTVSSVAYSEEDTVYTASCDSLHSISTKVSVHRHLFDFERGDGFGYGLFYDVSGKQEIPIYNNGFSANDNYGTPAWYAGWEKRGEHLVNGATYEFAPLPGTVDTPRLKIFELPIRTYNRNAHPPELDTPPFMNIFLAPELVSETDFNTIASCLNTYKNDINKSLQRLGSYFPGSDQRYYHPLRLGGIVYGLPPYSDPKYIDMINAVWGEAHNDKVIPAFGRFTLYPGQSAKGTIGSNVVIVSVNESSEPEFQVDGKKIITPSQWSNDKTMIMPMNYNTDKSVTFDVSNREYNANGASYFESDHYPLKR